MSSIVNVLSNRAYRKTLRHAKVSDGALPKCPHTRLVQFRIISSRDLTDPCEKDRFVYFLWCSLVKVHRERSEIVLPGIRAHCSIAFYSIGYKLEVTFMSFLFHRRTKKIAQYLWGVVAILVILGMVIFFAPGLVSLLSGNY